MTLETETVQSDRPSLERFDPGWPELFVNPYPIYDRYREADPVHWGVTPNPQLPGSWYTFRFADCVSALADPRLKSNPASVGMADAFPPAFEPVAHVFLEWLGALDPPKHTRIRGVMAKTFTPRRMRELRPRVDAIADELLVAALANGGAFDLVESYAFPLPMAVIGDMLGVPTGDREQFRELSTEFAQAIDQPGNPQAAEIGSRAALQMLDYFKGLLAERRTAPTEDLMTAMMQAASDDGQTMTEFEILATAIELIVAGHETTVNTATKATHGMLELGVYSEIAANPQMITGDGMEELLRWTSPLQRQRNRWATEPMELGGKTIAVGDSVVVMLGAANRDPDQFPNPSSLNFAREASRHMTFGHGPHFCLGANLARMEIGSALQTLFRLAPKLRLAGVDVQWRQNALIPGPSSLYVECPS